MGFAGAVRVNATLRNAPSFNTERSDAVQRLETLARASVALSRLAPQLSAIAETVANGAQEQARQSQIISTQADRMARELEGAVSGLRESSGSVQEFVGTIKRVADQTKILSINASIEAARAGQVGAAFAIVAKEVQSLSGQTTQATVEIADRVEAIRSDIHAAVEAAGLQRERETGESRSGEAMFGMAQLSAEVTRIARIAEENASASDGVRSTSHQVRSLSEELLMAVHDHSVEIFRQVLSHPSLSKMRRFPIEAHLRDTVAAFRIFELLYVTDAEGHQITANIWKDGRDGANRLGADWEDRPWFNGVRASGEIQVSDIYRSRATDNFCFTISGPIYSGADLVGVLAADVNFAELVAI